MNYRRITLIFGFLILISMSGLFPAQPSAAVGSLSDIELIVSLEWQPGYSDTVRDAYGNKCTDFTEADFVEHLKKALAETSVEVYGYTDGQVWISRYSVFANGENWNDADIRILVNSNFRPTAYLGGFEDAVREVYTDDGRKITFAPGGIFLGRLWNGIQSDCGLWDAPAGVATIAHELGHHVLGLGDGYAPNLKASTYDYCSSTSHYLPGETQPDEQDSVMSYQYAAARLRTAGEGIGCENTPQTFLYHQSDWETVEWLHGLVPPTDILPPPVPAESAQVDVFIAYDREVGSSMMRLEEPAQALAFSVQGSFDAPERLLEQGIITNDEPAAWLGVRQGTDWPLIVGWDWETGTLYGANPNPLEIETTNQLELVKPDWSANLVVKPVVSMQTGTPVMTGLEVEGSECLAKSKYVGVTLCPAGGPCHDVATVTPSGGEFSYTFDLTSEQQAQMGAGRGAIYAFSPIYGNSTVTSYQVSGGFGPATAEIHTPLADGAVSVDIDPENSSNVDGSTLLISQSVPACLVPEIPAAVVQWPTLIQPFEVNSDGAFPWDIKEPALMVQLAYNPALFSGTPNVLVYDPANPNLGWQQLNVSAISAELGLITVEAYTFLGQGLLYALSQ